MSKVIPFRQRAEATDEAQPQDHDENVEALAEIRTIKALRSDAGRGMAWWNAISESERAHWLRMADSAVPADAWRAFNTLRLETALELLDRAEFGDDAEYELAQRLVLGAAKLTRGAS